MQFLNKVHRTHDKNSFTHDDIIKSVSTMIKVQDRTPYLEEMAGQAEAFEFFRGADGKLKATNVKTKVTVNLDESGIPPQIITILDKYFAENKDPVDVLVNSQGQVLRINPEVDADPSVIEQVKAAITKSNLWRLKSAQKPASQPTDYVEGASTDDALEKLTSAMFDIINGLEKSKFTIDDVADAISDAVDDYSISKSDNGPNDEENDKEYDRLYTLAIKHIKAISTAMKGIN